MSDIPVDIWMVVNDLYREYGAIPSDKVAEAVNAERSRLEPLIQVALDERDRAEDSLEKAVKHLAELVECLDWWQVDEYDREFPGDSLIDARAFLASLSHSESPSEPVGHGEAI